MQTALLIILIIAIAILIILQLRKNFKDSGQDKALENIREEIKEMKGNVTDSLKGNLDFLQKQTSHSAKLISEITEKLTKLDDTNKQVVDFTEQLQNLQNILKNPKQRGILGEYWLENLLSNALSPNDYESQYKFKNGEAVDFVIKVKDKIIPIDAKFTLEKYSQMMESTNKSDQDQLQKDLKRDLKNRIDETAKYIRPNEGTTDFAFMFIPAEGVFYNLLAYKVGDAGINSQDLINYAFSKSVTIVSPATFFAYLQVIVRALNSLKVEDSVQEVIKNVQNLGRHLKKYDEYMQKLGKSIATSVNMYESAYKEFAKIDKDVVKLTDGDKKDLIEPLEIDKPNLDN